MPWLRVYRYADLASYTPLLDAPALATGSAVLAGALRLVRQTRWCRLPVLMLRRWWLLSLRLEALLHRVTEDAFGCYGFPLAGGRATLDGGGQIVSELGYGMAWLL